jgi:hypothetical protein
MKYKLGLEEEITLIDELRGKGVAFSYEKRGGLFRVYFGFRDELFTIDLRTKTDIHQILIFLERILAA